MQHSHGAMLGEMTRGEALAGLLMIGLVCLVIGAVLTLIGWALWRWLARPVIRAIAELLDAESGGRL